MTDLRDMHLRLPSDMHERLRQAAQEEQTQTLGKLTVMARIAIGEWLDRRDAERQKREA